MYPMPAMWSSWSFEKRWFQTLSPQLMRFHDTCMLSFWKLVGCTTSRYSYLKRAIFSSFLSCTAQPHLLELPFSPFVSDVFLISSIFRIIEISASQFSSPLPTRVSLFRVVFPMSGHTSVHTFSGVIVAWIWVSLSLDHILNCGGKVNILQMFTIVFSEIQFIVRKSSLWRFSLSIMWTLWIVSKNLRNTWRKHFRKLFNVCFSVCIPAECTCFQLFPQSVHFLRIQLFDDWSFSWNRFVHMRRCFDQESLQLSLHTKPILLRLYGAALPVICAK